MSDPRTLSGIERFACAHSETTPPDDDGYALCLRCAASVPVRLTKPQLDRAMLAILGWGRRD